MIAARLEAETSAAGDWNCQQADDTDARLIETLNALADRRCTEDGRLRDIAIAVANHLAAPSLRIWSLTPERDQLCLREAVGLDLPFEGLQDRVPVDRSELGQVVKTHEPCFIDMRAESTPAEVQTWAARHGIASFIAVAVAVDTRLWGVLGVFTRARILDRQRKLLSEVAAVVGRCVDRSASNIGPVEPADVLASLVPCLSSAVVVLDDRGLIVRWSNAAERLFGWSEAEVLGGPLPMIPEPACDEFGESATVGDWLRHTRQTRMICRRVDLTDVPVQRTTAPLYNCVGEVAGRVEVYSDDSQRVQTSRCLQVQAQTSRILSDCRGLEDGIPLVLDAIGKWLGCEAVEFWRRIDGKNALVRAGVWGASSDARDRLAATELRIKLDAPRWLAPAEHENRLLFAQDILAPTESARAATRGGLHVVTAGLAIPVKGNGASLGVVACLGQSLSAPDELESQTLGFIADALAQFLTRHRTEAELARSEARLRQTQKMDALGLLAGGVAHDFNNLLTIILAYSEMGLADVDPTNPLHEMLAEIHGAGERAAAMTKKLLAVSRQQPAPSAACNLNQLVVDMDKILRRLIGPQITLTCNCETGLAPVHADPNQLEQVLLNLIVNARDAMPDGGAITLTTRNVDRSVHEARRQGSRPGAFVELTVKDTGCGMDPETQARIFEPFFTTKGAGKGTGMGLSTVLSIVEQSGGFIEVQSEVNAGATFAAYLPLARVALATQSIDAPTPSYVGTESILVVDSDDALRALIRRLLEVRGYTVYEAAHGGEARKLLDARKPTINLVLTELQLPIVDGAALCRSLRSLTSRTKLLLMSGSSEPPGDLNLDLSRQFLRKPFTSSDLAQRVRSALEAE